MYQYKAKVVSVHDGDTIKVDLDMGLNFWRHDIGVRLARIDAPELVVMIGGKRTVVQAGEESTQVLLKALGRDNFTTGRTKSTFGIPGDYLVKDGCRVDLVINTMLFEGLPDTEKYGRVLGEIMLPDYGNLSDLMVANGAALYKEF